ncbi:MAG: asparagine synthase (glutamine-hydrolyzing) [Holophaga sp.]|nr:asparagine synthase (glutamine-hydrolyzing) [Holophaga sp.]
MCGLAGCWQAIHPGAEALEARVRRMTDTLALRGPDDRGSWVDAGTGIALGFRRLAILDLSPEGHQPMASASGRYILTFNGEIYNHRELGRSLASAGAQFRGHSDTEVLLAAFEQWGVEPALRRCNGMFAIACWDALERRLHLARDPLGIKPLYLGSRGRTLFWGSELKALLAHPEFVPAIDPDGLSLYFRHGYVPGPYSIFQGVSKLPPGCLVTLAAPDAQPEHRPFWSLQEVAARSQADPFLGSDLEAMDAVEAALARSVELQMVADVPLGAFLSGGIDSSLAVALMQRQSSRPVKTFSIGFKDDAFNEAVAARAVSRHLGTEHAEWLVTAQDALELIPRIPQIYDEPIADPAALPTCLVSQLARREVTVSLSGDGGDELFGGYHFHLSAQEGRLARALRLPAPLRGAIGAGMATCARVLQHVPGRMAGHAEEAVLFRARPYLFRDSVSYYREQVADMFGRGDTLLLAERDPPYLLNRPLALDRPRNVAESFMFLDTMMMLPDEFLTKIDRAAMAVSLEGRVPYLDLDVIALAWRLPTHLKIRAGQGKWVLRQILKRHLPADLVDRPKHGFSVPLSDWLRGPLRPWAGELLDRGRIRQQGLLAPAMVERYWSEHQHGGKDHLDLLWRLLMFQAWQDTWLHTATEAAS